MEGQGTSILELFGMFWYFPPSHSFIRGSNALKIFPTLLISSSLLISYQKKKMIVEFLDNSSF